ncbi:MAG TPA: hypothetical protein VKB80_24150 [Kofleriaceae bacterium]|nr:hypothetical protein [Kofleriaceae bacterium]
MITRDVALKRSIKRLTTATGATADFVAEGGQVNPTRPIDLAIFDARYDLPDKRFLSQIPRGARILYIVSGEDLIHRVSLFEDQRATSLFCHDERFDDDEFISSATKALRGEIFGLQKYFPWGVTTFTMLVKSYEEKSRAIDIMMRYAQLAGVRGPVRDRIQLVADELMMNALYHAPTDDHGQEKFRGMTLKQLAQLSDVNPIQVQYGCSGRYFGVAVRDGGGSLTRERALEYLGRARTGAQMEQKESGAGLGLVSVLHSVSKLVFNLAPTYSTEVIGLLDMELFAHGKVGARSLHLFTAAASTEARDEEADEAGEAPRPRPRRRAGGWVLAAAVGAAAAGLGTAYTLQRGGAEESPPASHAAPPVRSKTITVYAEPSGVQIVVGGRPADSGVPVVVPPGTVELPIEVTYPGYRPWSRTLSATDLFGDERIYVVQLDRER